MMDELVQKLSEKTGLPPDKAQEVVNVVVSHLKEKLPEPLANSLESVLASNPSQSESFLDRAKAMASGLGNAFGKQPE